MRISCRQAVRTVSDDQKISIGRVQSLDGASAKSRGQFAKQFRLENERVRSTGHYVTWTNGRPGGGAKEARRARQREAEGTATNHPRTSRLMLRLWDSMVPGARPGFARYGTLYIIGRI